MNINGLADMHTHSDFSPDAKSSPEQMCESAVRLGLAAYAITDHCDCNMRFPPEHYTDDVSALKDADMYGSQKYALDSIAYQTKLKERYQGRLELICGIELGQPLQDMEFAQMISCDERLDFIIGSHHQNRGEDDFYSFEYNKMDSGQIGTLLENCFLQTLDMCRWGGFDVLGHLTYPLRYIEGDYGISVDMSRYEDIIREIFCTLIQSGKGIEINTSGLWKGYGKTLPVERLIKMYRQLGGEILTVGSDAHNADDVGKGIAEGAELAKNVGFGYLTVFKKRTANFIKI